jgi:hypothetical protein
MKARIITKIYLHYLKSNPEKGLYHFVLEDNGMILNNLPIFSNSTIDNDECALHLACMGVEKMPEKAKELSYILGYINPEYIEVFEEPKAKKKKKE